MPMASRKVRSALLQLALVFLFSGDASGSSTALRRSVSGSLEHHVLGSTAAGNSISTGAHSSNKTEKLRTHGFFGKEMSPSMWCILISTVQCFVIYLLLQIVQTANQMRGPDHKLGLEEALKSTRKTVDILPMLCCVFIATRMRALEINPTGGPPAWAQTCMYVATFSVVAATVLDLLSGVSNSQIVHKTFGSLELIILFTVYISTMIVIFSNFFMSADAGSSVCPDCPPYTPGLAPALRATILMTLLFFVFNGSYNVTSLYNKNLKPMRGHNHGRSPKGTLELKLETTQEPLQFCPMLAILFIGARMRALQLQATARGPANRAANISPQSWAQYAFYTCVLAVFGQLISRVLVASPTAQFQAGAKARDASRQAGVVEDMNQGVAASGGTFIAKFLEIVCMVFMFAALITIIVSVFEIKIPEYMNLKTPPVSPAMNCAMALTLLFFSIHLLRTLVRMYRDLIIKGQEINAEHVLEGAVPTLAIIPVLCVLFIAARIRCLEIDPVNGSPAKWTQDLMITCVSFAGLYTFLSMACVMVSNYLRDPNEITPRDDGYNASHAQTRQALKRNQPRRAGALVWIMNLLMYISVVVVYGCAIGVIVGIMVKT